jgi:hypothetical protein
VAQFSSAPAPGYGHNSGDTLVKLPTLHSDQLRVHMLTRDPRGTDPTVAPDLREAWSRVTNRFRVGRCGRRYGKTTYGRSWLGRAAINGEYCGWFAPAYRYISEVYNEFVDMLAPVIVNKNKTDGIIRLEGGGLIEFWTMEDDRAGRSRKYHKVVLDEAAYTKNRTAMQTWKTSIEPTLLDYRGKALAISNTLGNDTENFLYQLCNEPKHGFLQFHAPSTANPLLPLRRPGESFTAWQLRRAADFAELKKNTDPLVYLQEYEAEFVDWSGVAFFSIDKMLMGGLPVAAPGNVDLVFCIIDSASKTEALNDGTACTWFGLIRRGHELLGYKLVVLDWNIAQIEGSLLETWLPEVLQRGEALALQCRARGGFVGAWIEDAASGIILLQQALRKGLAARPIPEALKALGKDQRALNASGYHFRGEVKIAREAYDKVTTYKNATRNHFIAQVSGFRMADKDANKRADDLLDTYCYGIAVALAGAEGL